MLHVCACRAGAARSELATSFFPWRFPLQVVLGCVQTLCDSPFVDDDDSLVVHTCNGEVRWRLTCLAK